MARKELRAHALKHPGAGPDLFVGVKLPRSLFFARTHKFVAKFGYGMDKSGWVAARESYEAVAPAPAGRKRLTAQRAR